MHTPQQSAGARGVGCALKVSTRLKPISSRPSAAAAATSSRSPHDTPVAERAGAEQSQRRSGRTSPDDSNNAAWQHCVVHSHTTYGERHWLHTEGDHHSGANMIAHSERTTTYYYTAFHPPLIYQQSDAACYCAATTARRTSRRGGHSLGTRREGKKRATRAPSERR
jgi:hypothetical protein